MEATIDVANQRISDTGLRMPETDRDAFRCREEVGGIYPELARCSGEWSGFRNVAVHDCLTIDHGIGYKGIGDDLGDRDGSRGGAPGGLDSEES